MSTTTQKIIDHQNFYSSTMTSGTIWSWDISFTVWSLPTYTRGWLVISPDVASKREVCFYNISWGQIVIKKENRFGPNYADHSISEVVQLNSIGQFPSFSQEIASTTAWIEKTGWLNIKVYGWPTLVNGSQKSPADTNILLPISSTSYVYYDPSANTFSSTTTFANIAAFQWVAIADITTNTTSVTNINYRNYKFWHLYYDTSSFSIDWSGRLTINPIVVPTVPWSFVQDVSWGTLTWAVNGSNNSYTLSGTPLSASSFTFYINWLLQTSWTDYTRTWTALTVASAPLTWDILIAQYLI